MTLTQWLPFIETARGYKRAWLLTDVSAGLTLALLSLPQAIAYAIMAGLPPIYGLYSCVVVGIVGSLMGSSEHLVPGPTNSVAILIGGMVMASSVPEVRENPTVVIPLLALLIGGTQLLFGLLKLGNLTQFVSRSVVVGFTAGAGLLIALNQLAPLLGVKQPDAGHMLEQVWMTLQQLDGTNFYALGIGLGTILVTATAPRWLPRWLPAPLVVVVVSAVVVEVFNLSAKGVMLVGDLPRTLPAVHLPLLNLRLIADIADDALAMAILGCIETLSIAKSIAMTTDQRVNNNQGCIGLGLGNIAAAFFQCMPGSGSFTRSAFNFLAGAKTRFAGVLSGLWIIAILTAFGHWVHYIPLASLAGLLVVLGFSMLQWHHIRVAFRATRSDAIVLVLTFVSALVLGLRQAIYVGVISSLVLFLRKASAPHLVEYDLAGDQMREINEHTERSHPEISIIHVEGELFFGAAELFEDEVRRLAHDRNIRVVILRMKNARHLDATAVMALEALLKFLRTDGRLLLISGPSAGVMGVLRRSGLLDEIGRDCVFESEENLTASTRKALVRARQFLGKEAKPEVRVFYEQSRAEKQSQGKPGIT
ncbi:MAG: SulP family inorganic anion transporter [Verrucomicrobia bacterium]|nr:SulP family inorganic anion transporter [Verrucomicrobiota bacterium]